MNPKWIGCVALLSLIWAGASFAGSVYFWTDEDGVRHYSNTGLPSDVQEAEVRPEEISPEVSTSPPEAGVDNELEPAFPVDQVGAPGEEAPETEGGQEASGRMAAKIEKERQRLKAEIEMIEGLGIGKSFTPGMKKARIRPLQEQLALLNADPDRYFRMKREGAFGGSQEENYVEPPPEALATPLEPSEPVSSSGASGDEAPPAAEQE